MADISTALVGVEMEDRVLVQEVISVIDTMKLCSAWNVTVMPRGYEIIGWIINKEDINITLDDLDLIQQVNRLRVLIPSVKLHSNLSKACVRVFVISHKEPIMLQEQTILRIKKRKVWL